MLKIQKFRKFIVANWKLNGSFSFSRDYIKNIDLVESNKIDNCLIICPPIPYINEIKSKSFFLGAQNCSEKLEGAYTGEISVKMLRDIGCAFCIIGHSERRNSFNDTDEIIYQKLNNCLQNDIVPILCIGETLLQKKDNLTNEVLKNQLQRCLSQNFNLENLIIAYEPIWSIGTGMVPKVEEISITHKYIKEKIFSESKIKILYGGSVKSNNYKEIINTSEVDGLLVGGASINIEEFNKIIKF